MGLPFGVAAWFFYRIARDAVTRSRRASARASHSQPSALSALTGAAGFCADRLDDERMDDGGVSSWRPCSSSCGRCAVRRSATPARRLPRPDSSAGWPQASSSPPRSTRSRFQSRSRCAFGGDAGTRAVTVAFVAATGAGFALAYGYWAFVLWERFGNPFFPYFNELFRSEYWDARPFFDTRFRPTTLAQLDHTAVRACRAQPARERSRPARSATRAADRVCCRPRGLPGARGPRGGRTGDRRSLRRHPSVDPVSGRLCHRLVRRVACRVHRSTATRFRWSSWPACCSCSRCTRPSLARSAATS